MSEEYGNNFVTVTDDEGNEFELEHLDTAELESGTYMAFLPADMDEDDDDFGLVILKVINEGEDEVFVTIEDEDELQAAYACFLERLSEEEEEGDA